MNEKIKQFSKIFGFNIFLLIILIFLPAFLFDLLKKEKRDNDYKSDKLHLSPAFLDSNKAKEILNSPKNLFEYYPFSAYRHTIYKSKFLNLEKKNGFTFRKSKNISQVNFDDSTWFFGGSTMAGSGVDDLNTIPSLYSKLTNENVINFGVPGWNSRQSLNLLINLLSAGYKPSKVIFYDGINEIYNCREDASYSFTHSEEKIFQKRFNNNSFLDILKSKSYSELKNFVDYLSAPYKSFLNDNSNKKEAKEIIFECHLNDKKLNNVSNNLFLNWSVANNLSDMYGFKFYSVLQPSLYTSGPIPGYIPETYKSGKTNISWGRSHIEVNKRFKEILNKSCKDSSFQKINNCSNFFDLTQIFKSNSQPLFFDQGHLGEKGNSLIAERIYQQIKALN